MGVRSPTGIRALRSPTGIRALQYGALPVADLGRAYRFYAQVLGARLERLLNAAGHRGDVLNAGVPGYSTLDNLIRLQTELYRLGPDKYRMAVRIAWARSGEATDVARWREALRLPEQWQAPEFPLRGQDITALGITGPEVGEILRRLERIWIEGDFKGTREVLLERARG